MTGEGEFAFVERLAARLPDRPPGQVGVGDDCAVLEGNRLIATDLLVEGVHFRSAWASPTDIGWKALAVNLSDIAAMGGDTATAPPVLATMGSPDSTFGILKDLLGRVEIAQKRACDQPRGDDKAKRGAICEHLAKRARNASVQAKIAGLQFFVSSRVRRISDGN